jgi:hypothetical protein
MRIFIFCAPLPSILSIGLTSLLFFKCYSYEKAPRLLLLNTNQLSSLLVKLSQLHKSGKVTEHSQSILAIIPVCFPEYHDRPEITGGLIFETCLKYVTESILSLLKNKIITIPQLQLTFCSHI